MNLELVLAEKIGQEAQKLILRYHAYHNSVHAEHLRNKVRLGANAPEKFVDQPEYWAQDKKFNPFYVYKKRRQIAKSIATKIKKGTYSPNAPYIKEIDKPGGGKRHVTIFQIPDASVSSFCYENLLKKNKHRFSSFSYAYRNDRNVHFAIQDIAVDISQHPRTFIAEFDFSDFFGSINHNYLYNQFDKNGFFISKEELQIIKSFLSLKDRGIPQGTSISLFLANVVCWEMDKQFEVNGLQFARYADDTVVWSRDYTKICKSFEIISEFSKKAGVEININKSDGISLLTKSGLPSEIGSYKHNIEFLGYSISVDNTSIKKKSEIKIKKQISYILYRNLIQPLRKPQLTGISIPANDEDRALLTAMMQIRRYLYGNLTENMLIDYLMGRRRSLRFKGLMSFYPLVNNEEQLRGLDGWLCSTIYRCVQLRGRLLKDKGFDKFGNFPFNANRDALISQLGNIEISGKKLLKVPSFLKIYHALQRGLSEGGIEHVMNQKSGIYNYFE